jgi:neurotransmitter:Na+ symporter, NSS family
MIAYASYLPEKANLSRNALLTGTINCSFSLISGFAVFSVLGFMATSQGKPITEVVTQSIGLAFVAYPKAVSLIPGGRIFGAIFFLSLVLAGLSSSISIIEAFSSSIVDKFNVPKKKLVTILCGMGLLGSVIFTCRGGLFWLDITDHFLSHYGLVVVGILECVLLGWVFDIRKLREHINRISSIKLSLWWDNLIRYFIPIVLSVIFISDVYREINSPYEGHSWTSLISIGFGWILVTLVTALIISLKPWRNSDSNE